MEFIASVGYRAKLKESEKRDEYQDLVRDLKKTMGHESDSDTDCNWCTWNSPQRMDKGSRRLRNQRKSRDHPDYRITKIGQNTEKSPGDARRLAVIQTPVKKYLLSLV